jgi:hypothetical protein
MFAIFTRLVSTRPAACRAPRRRGRAPPPRACRQTADAAGENADAREIGDLFALCDRLRILEHEHRQLGPLGIFRRPDVGFCRGEETERQLGLVEIANVRDGDAVGAGIEDFLHARLRCLGRRPSRSRDADDQRLAARLLEALAVRLHRRGIVGAFEIEEHVVVQRILGDLLAPSGVYFGGCPRSASLGA